VRLTFDAVERKHHGPLPVSVSRRQGSWPLAVTSPDATITDIVRNQLSLLTGRMVDVTRLDPAARKAGTSPVRARVASGVEVSTVPGTRANVKNEKQYEALKDKGMSKSRAARIANSEGSSSRGGKASGSGKKNSNSSQGGTTAQKKKAGSKGGKAAAKKS
jgi:hypothetical protein